jgi:flagellar biosynthesis protein FliR
MSLTVDTRWLLAALLVSIRVASATMLVPVLGPAQIPGAAKVVFTLALSAMLVSVVPVGTASIDSVFGLLGAAAGEIVLGAAFAFGFLCAYAVTQIAGRTLDVQMGFGAASLLNPTTQVPAPLVGGLLGMVGVAVFLSMDGHHVLIRALAASVQSLPPGQLAEQLPWAALMQHSAVAFTFALALAAPVMFVLLLADLAMALFARSMPQLNVFVLSFAVKIVVGIAALALSVRLANAVLTGLFEGTFMYWGELASR